MKTILIFGMLLVAQLANADTYQAKYIPTGDYEKMDEAEQQEFDVLIDGMIEEVCGLDARIAIANNTISRQKEVAKLTGTVNVTQMNNAGGALVDATANRNKRNELYKKLMGKDLKGYTCE